VRSTLETLARIVSDGQTADAAAVAWHRLVYADIVHVRSVLLGRYPPVTAATYLGRLRQVMRECWRLGLIGRDAMERALDVPAISAHLMPQRVLSTDELAALWHVVVADSIPQGARDLALLAVLIGTGLRRNELAALDLSDVDLTTGRLIVRRGKGNKPREAWLSVDLLPYLQAWLAVRGGHAGSLWHPIQRRQGFICRDRRLSGHRIVEDLGHDRAAEAGVPPFGLHSLRRSFATGLDKSGVRLKTIAALLGHARPETTIRYYVQSERSEAEAAARNIKPPTA
jgi:integrase